jgi:hypothetical protein
MTEPTRQRPHEDPLDPAEARERRTADLLRSERPVPADTFRGELALRLGAGSEAAAGRTLGGFSPRALSATSLSAGLALLAIVAAGLAGAGPFAV